MQLRIVKMTDAAIHMEDEDGAVSIVQMKAKPVEPIPTDYRVRWDHGGVTLHKAPGKMIVSLDRQRITLADALFACEVMRRWDRVQRNLTVNAQYMQKYVDGGYYARCF